MLALTSPLESALSSSSMVSTDSAVHRGRLHSQHIFCHSLYIYMWASGTAPYHSIFKKAAYYGGRKISNLVNLGHTILGHSITLMCKISMSWLDLDNFGSDQQLIFFGWDLLTLHRLAFARPAFLPMRFRLPQIHVVLVSPVTPYKKCVFLHPS